ncbi:MAG: restriction endonuclease subunit S [Advenella sp.]|uniref:restriction endonuclease subunit S n=1 Tax=Advenella sp. TaxID=1872388 RepID=UPI00258BD980|nr:restriction endonuclease subunit S [Advenella sp.]MDD3757528.1 restriction endonuclease subunit S [Advenella sp.]
MNNLGFIEKLLDGVEVVPKRLGDIVRIKNGKDHKSLGDGEYPVYGSGGVMRYADSYAYNKPSVLIPRKGSLGNLFFVDVPFWTVDTIFYTEIDESQVSPKYLYYFLTTVGLGEMNQAGGVPSQTQSVLNELKIPIPCPDNPKKSLEIQAEIVRILDAFTAMTAELTAELNLRRQQYNYYRNQLLSFEEGEVEWKTLGEVVNIKNGKDWKKLGTGEIPVYGSGGIMQYVDTFAYDKPTVLIPRKGSITNIFYVDTPFWNVDTIYYTEIDTNRITPKFFYYFMTTIDLMQLDTGSGRPSLTQAILNQIRVPVPQLEEQNRIVAILDKFDTLTTSLTEGLPREIELRQQQYEYYRDLLLSFPKSEAA